MYEYSAIKSLSTQERAQLEAECAALRPACVEWLARRLDIPEDQAEDVYQTAYIRAVGAIRRGLFQGDSSVKTWFFKIAEREQIDRVRSCASRLLVSVEAMREGGGALARRSGENEEVPEWEPRPGPDAHRHWQPIPPPFQALLDAEREAGLSSATGRILRAVSGKLRPVVEMFYLAGEECPSIARKLGIPKGTVLTRLHQARKQLRRRFARNKHPRSVDAMIRAVVPVAAIALLSTVFVFSQDSAASGIRTHTTTSLPTVVRQRFRHDAQGEHRRPSRDGAAGDAAESSFPSTPTAQAT